jgi:GTP-binding protein
MAPLDQEIDCVEQVRQLEVELERFDAGLMHKPRWLVMTKSDLLQADQAVVKAGEIVAELGWTGEWAVISAASANGTRELMQRVSDALLELDVVEAEEAEEPVDDDLPQAEYPEHPPSLNPEDD